jgi:hypothetical protein
VVYCVKCEREWGGHSHYGGYTWYYGGTPYRVTWSAGETSSGGSYEIYTTNNTRVTDQNIISAYNSQPHTKGIEGTDFVGNPTACTHNN